MYLLAILIGGYAYGIFFLGIFSLLFKSLVISYTLFFAICVLVLFKSKIIKPKISLKPKATILNFVFLLIVLQSIVNLIGVFGPELSFDALWYHLTIPKLYFQSNSIFFIPGGLLYYSAMPKLVEMLYISSIAINGEIAAKIVHFSFGLLVVFSIYIFSKKYLDKFYAALASLLFYSNLVVGWESITAFVDLGRAFFELLAFASLLVFLEKKQIKWVIISATIVSFAIGTKLLALGSVFILIFILILILVKKNENILGICRIMLLYLFIVLFVSAPWFIFSFAVTGNPFFPLFSPVLQQARISLSIVDFAMFVWNLFLFSSDKVSPLYLLIIFIIPFMIKKLNFKIHLMLLYCFMSLVFCFIIPYPGAGRFILPYLPVFSIVVLVIVSKVNNNLLKNSLIVILILLACYSIVYRSAANFKYVNVLLGIESREHFLSTHLKYDFGDFYDIDGYFKKNIKKNDNVLIYGIHNLYYIDFSYVHSSWVKEGDVFNYILTQDTEIPQRFWNWKMIYENSTTHVKLYSQGGVECSY